MANGRISVIALIFIILFFISGCASDRLGGGIITGSAASGPSKLYESRPFENRGTGEEVTGKLCLCYRRKLHNRSEGI